jgi:hypothetical protein
MPAITIFFYHPKEAYGLLSNFSQHPIELEDKVWPTSEHFFQAMKSLDPDVQEHIRNLDSPGKAKNYAHTIELREDWESPVGTPALHAMFTDEWGCAVELTKDHFMYSALIAKFTQHEDLRRGLLATGSAILVEDTIGDPYWGNGPSQNGLNKLGRQLMFVRKRLLETV